MLCGAMMGCNESQSPDSRTDSTAGQPTTVTANRPVIPDQSVDKSELPDRTNSEVNVRDRDDATLTPLDQNENKSDITITADIRSQVVDTKMSVDAQNVKIITQDGKVTLRGPVQSAEEKLNIERIAKEVAGSDNVDSQLEVDKDE